MPFDYYGARLRHAAWTWLEAKFCRFLHPLRSKDRASGRNEKRSAKQREQRARDKEW